MADLKCEITRHLGIVKEKNGGWNKELNLVRWSGGSPKYDIRDWSGDHTKMSKGITLTEEELISLYDLIDKLFYSDDNSYNGDGIAAYENNRSDYPKDAFIEELSELEQELNGEYND